MVPGPLWKEVEAVSMGKAAEATQVPHTRKRSKGPDAALEAQASAVPMIADVAVASAAQVSGNRRLKKKVRLQHS